jgi:UDP-N-acetylmuramyl pentapeptide phosphotransferase/UDP-N-acetylglucosamine-1-phosphate transferase
VWLLRVFCVLLSVWLVNLYNFMDGMDGLAGGMAVIGFGTLALLGYLAGSPAYAAAALVVAAAAGGFLPFNFPPARLFMGDVGSGSLGFLAAFFILLAERLRLFPLWMSLLVFSPFVVDASWTLIRRACKGRIPWQAHREHFYQRLVRSGWSHRRTTLWSYILMLKCAALAVLASWCAAAGVQGLLLGWMILMYLAIIAYVNARERRPLSEAEGA